MKLSDIMTREEYDSWGNEDLASWMARQSPERRLRYYGIIKESMPRTRPDSPYEGQQYLDEEETLWIHIGTKWISLRDFHQEDS